MILFILNKNKISIKLKMGDTGNKDVFIEVPQGCYAVIKENSPSNIKGLLTTGLNICNCIIVTDKEHKNMVLAHVDGNHTNLLDKDHGLLSWIEQIPGRDVEIYYGRKVFKKIKIPRGATADEKEEIKRYNKKQRNKARYYNKIYKDQIDYVLSLVGENKSIKLNDILHKHDEGNGTCLFIRKENEQTNEDEQPKYLKDLDSLLIETDNYFENLDYDNPDDQDYIFKFNSLNNFLSTQFLQNKDIVDRYIDCLLRYKSEASWKKQIPLFQLTHKIYGNQKIELNDVRFITTNMPLPPVCCYNGVGQPNKFDEVWDCLNNEGYKNNMSDKIIEYGDIINEIYADFHGDIINDDVVENFKNNHKYNFLSLHERLMFVNDLFGELLRAEDIRQNER